MAKKDLSDLLAGRSPDSEHSPGGPSVPGEPGKNRGVSWVALAAVLILALAASGSLGYFLKEQSLQLAAIEDRLSHIDQTVQLLGTRLDGDGDEIATLKSQLQVTMDRVGVTQRELGRARDLAQQLREEQQKNVAALTEEIQQKANAEKVEQLAEQSTERFDGVDREISAVKEDVKSARQDLLSTIEELADLGVTVNEQGQMIATNMAGVEELRRRGERDYETFELERNARTRVAGITLELRDTDGDPLDADIRIYANDTAMERSDVPANAPINLYVGTDRIPYEVVLVEISNKPDRVKGYVSGPKGKLSGGPPQLSTND